MQMKNFNKIFLGLVPLVFILNSGFSQQNEIKIRFIANAGLHLTDGSRNLYIDFPYKSGFYIYSKYDRSEITHIKDRPIFIFTHKHPDHYSIRRVRKLKGAKYGSWNIPDLQKLSDSIPGFLIQAFKTEHQVSKKHYSYLITWHGKKIFISGDTEHADTIATISNMDWAFVPAWLLTDAQRKKIKIDAKRIGVYHIGPGDHITTQDPKIWLMDKQGEVISIPY
jgi:L-ascorbate metabolism protein UlaG (beta-lactamase superfamily)